MKPQASRPTISRGMPQAKTFGQIDLGGNCISSSRGWSRWIWLLMPSMWPAPTTATMRPAGSGADLLCQERIPLVDQALFDLRETLGEFGHDRFELVLLLELLDHVHVDLLGEQAAHEKSAWPA